MERLLLGPEIPPGRGGAESRAAFTGSLAMACGLEVCFDDVERVGSFMELEILALEEDYERAKAVLLQTAADLGLTEKETRSYLGMVLDAQKT